MLEFQGCSSEQDLLGVSVRGHKGLSTQDQRGRPGCSTGRMLETFDMGCRALS